MEEESDFVRELEKRETSDPIFCDLGIGFQSLIILNYREVTFVEKNISCAVSIEFELNIYKIYITFNSCFLVELDS